MYKKNTKSRKNVKFDMEYSQWNSLWGPKENGGYIKKNGETVKKHRFVLRGEEPLWFLQVDF